MNISKKLMLIVLLTTLEVSITVFAAFEIAKGAQFHQLNFLHLKYINQLDKTINEIDSNTTINIQAIETDILAIRQQPINCLDAANALNKLVMKIINTHHALTLCALDVQRANTTLLSLEDYKNEVISRTDFLRILNHALDEFNDNSEQFEEPITKTVSFIFAGFIPLVIVISLFNIIFITYLSRTISSSIRNLTTLLSTQSKDKVELDEDLSSTTPDELKALLNAAKKRIKEDLLNLENSEELKEIVNSQTSSLQQANDELAQFAYRASHDLKSPLSGAKSLSKFIVEDIQSGNTEEAIKNAKAITKQMEKLETLVVDILLLAKADVGSKEAHIIDFDRLIIDIKERLFWLIQNSPCQLETLVNLTVPITSDKTRFAQIIENLISNALKYYDKNKQRPFVKCTIKNTQSDIVIIVSDNGIGIPEKLQSDVFCMFKRFHPEVCDGSGLGLSLVKKHVEFFDGDISFKSSNQGSTFKVTIALDKLL